MPLQDGIDNESYISLFKSIMEPTIHTFQPTAIVLQSGADSLGCDKIGAFNLSIAAHGECVRFIKAFNIPLVVLGGGGYRPKNVSRCWAYETAVLLDCQNEISNTLPFHMYDEYYAPDYKLHPPLTGRTENLNTRAALEKIRVSVLERLRFMHGAPSVALQEIPPNLAGWLADEADKELHVDERADGHRDRNDFYDKEEDQDAVASLSTSTSKRGSTKSAGKPKAAPQKKRKRANTTGSKVKSTSTESMPPPLLPASAMAPPAAPRDLASMELG